jgi:hypothetical protein
MTPERLIRSHRQHQHPPRLPAAVRLSEVLHDTVEHVVPAAGRRAGAASEDRGALVPVECERNEDAPEHWLGLDAVSVDLLLLCPGGDLEECRVNGVIRRETPGPLAFYSECDALEPLGLEPSELECFSVIGEAGAFDVTASFSEPPDGREHAGWRGDDSVGDGEGVALHCGVQWR